MAKQGLTLEQKQKQRLALEQQRLLGTILEKSDAEMEEYIDNKLNEIQALEKKGDDDLNNFMLTYRDQDTGEAKHFWQPLLMSFNHEILESID